MKTVKELREFLVGKPGHAWVKISSGDKEVYDIAFVYRDRPPKEELDICDARDALQQDYKRLKKKLEHIVTELEDY